MGRWKRGWARVLFWVCHEAVALVAPPWRWRLVVLGQSGPQQLAGDSYYWKGQPAAAVMEVVERWGLHSRALQPGRRRLPPG